MKRSYALVVSYHDGSGVIRAFGPYDTEADAKDAEPVLQDLYAPELGGKWDVVPLFTIATEEQPS